MTIEIRTAKGSDFELESGFELRTSGLASLRGHLSRIQGSPPGSPPGLTAGQRMA